MVVKTRQRRVMVSPFLEKLHTVADEFDADGEPKLREGWEMWLRAVCDEYVNAPVFPAAKKRDYYGYTDANGVYHPPMEVEIERHGVREIATMAGNEDYRPGSVWMTRRLFYKVWSDLTGINPDPALYFDRNWHGGEGGAESGAWYHPAQNRFQIMLRKKRLFTPHTIDEVRHHIKPIYEEQYSTHRRGKDGRAPKTLSQYMIEPRILKQINRDHVYDVFMERRAAFDIKALSPVPNARMWEWRDILKKLWTYPVFDRETIKRITADPDIWGADYATDETIDNHLTRWVKDDSLVRVRHGLYRPPRAIRDRSYTETAEEVMRDHDPEKHFLVDWFFEFMRREALRERRDPSRRFTFERMMADLDNFHPDWKLIGTRPSAAYMRMRLNKETGGMVGAPDTGFWIEKKGHERRLTEDALDIFCPEVMKAIKRRK